MIILHEDDVSFTVANNNPRNKSLSLLLELPDDNFPQGRCYLYGSYNDVNFTYDLATTDYVQ